MYKQVKDALGALSDKIIFRVVDNVYIPFDPANTDYQAYLKFLDEGGVPLPADEVTE